jgi:hypothetical protein
MIKDFTVVSKQPKLFSVMRVIVFCPIEVNFTSIESLCKLLPRLFGSFIFQILVLTVLFPILESDLSLNSFPLKHRAEAEADILAMG